MSWYLTYRCNYNCKYCGIPAFDSGGELKTSEVLSIIDDLKGMGTAIISFCGGEPLLRSDLGQIINYCRRKNVQTQVISNGALVPERIESLKNIYMLKLSFDGPEFIQDELRGPGAYKRTLQAASIAKKHKIKVAFNTTLNRLNLPYIEFIINKSKELKIPVRFSPLKYIHSGKKDIKWLTPPTGLYREKIAYIIREAKRNKYVLNSLPALSYLRFYPEGKKLNSCIGGRIFCHIKPNGDMHPCEGLRVAGTANCVNAGVKKAFSALPLHSCPYCWCTGTLELNMVYLFKIPSLIKVIKGTFE